MIYWVLTVTHVLYNHCFLQYAWHCICLTSLETHIRKITHRVRIQTQIQDQTLSNILWQCSKYLLETYLFNICELVIFNSITYMSTKTEHDNASCLSLHNKPPQILVAWNNTIFLAPISENGEFRQDSGGPLLFTWSLFPPHGLSLRVDTLDFLNESMFPSQWKQKPSLNAF